MLASQCTVLFVPFFHTGNKFNSVPLTKGLVEGDGGGRRRRETRSAAAAVRPAVKNKAAPNEIPE